jgi:hypothetical protein
VPRWAGPITASGKTCAKMTRSISPARTAPISCATTYTTACTTPTRPTTANAIVTAGLKCPPEIAPNAETITERIRPWASAMPTIPTPPRV